MVWGKLGGGGGPSLWGGGVGEVERAGRRGAPLARVCGGRALVVARERGGTLSFKFAARMRSSPAG